MSVSAVTARAVAIFVVRVRNWPFSPSRQKHLHCFASTTNPCPLSRFLPPRSPDITCITPVFESEPHAPGATRRIVFFVAARGHHADIGGIAPGSMPPHSKSLDEEGAQIVAHKLVAGGVFDEEGITRIMRAPGEKGIPGCAGSRNLKDCLSDLRAQVAANTRGIALVRGLISEYGLRTVHAYMRHIQSAAEGAVRDMLSAFSSSRGLPATGGTVTAVDHMDDGTPIALAVTIDRVSRTAVFDFTGTGPQVFSNTNAPRAVAYSAILYCLRCMVDQDGECAEATMEKWAGSGSV